jgi:hypothetical protein
MRSFKTNIIILSIVVTIVSSCEEVINIDLNTASPKITVTAIVTDQPGPYYVTLAKTESYFNSNDSFPPVRDAQISISDDAGNTDTLIVVKAGTYRTTKLQGVNGRNYHLRILSEGNLYEAFSYLPHPIIMDSISAQKITQDGPMKKDKDKKNEYYIKCFFNDPLGSTDFYRVESVVENQDTLASAYQIYSDEVSDGQTVVFPVQRPRFKIGDTAIVELYHINQANYDYFKTANNILRNKKGPMASASAPQANPLTNISGGAVGYFGTFAVNRKIIIIK